VSSVCDVLGSAQNLENIRVTKLECLMFSNGQLEIPTAHWTIGR